MMIDPDTLAEIVSIYHADVRVRDAAPEMLALLEELEWSGWRVDKESGGYDIYTEICPCCEGGHPFVENDRTGHAAHCRLAAVLKAARGE